MEELRHVGDRLRIALEAAGISGAQLAERMGVTRGMVSHWLQGRRAASDSQLQEIAEVLGMDSGWLVGRLGSSFIEPSGSMTTSNSPPLEWFFRPAPDDGGRDFGNPNVFAAPAELAILVREAGQNTTDVPLRPGGDIHMRFRVIELTAGESEYVEFMDAIRYDELKQHIVKAAHTESRVGTRLRGGLDFLHHSGKLMLLRIDDYGTTGLFGPETSQGDEKNPFAALVRNNLDSSKLTTTAGGSFGLGKALLWRCSDLSTVFFASEVAPPYNAPPGIRFIGKSELTWHQTGSSLHAGPGWLGAAESKGGSVWLSPGELGRLQMNRRELPDGVDSNRASGTSILIMGFRDPKSEWSADSATMAKTLAQAAALNFWPLMQDGRLRITVERQKNSTLEAVETVNPTEYVPHLCEAYARHRKDEVSSTLRDAGDVIRVSVPFTIPRTRPQATGVHDYPELTSTAQLVVRLGEDSDGTTKAANTVALVRGRKMVVKYWNRSNIVVGAQPFHAVLLAGEAVGNEIAQSAAEQFLRFSEPPTHDEWEFNDDLREKYQRGAGARLTELKDAVTRALQEAIRPAEVSEGKGPPELRQLFRIGGLGIETKIPATIRQARAAIREASWEVVASIHINDRSKPWLLIPRLWLDVESGPAVRLNWLTLTALEPTDIKREGDGFIVPPGTRQLRIEGKSESESEQILVTRCRARLDLRAESITSEVE